jgi:uncharacterized protein
METKIIPRKKYLERISKYFDKNIIKVITGQRRTGKSFFLLYLRDYLSARNRKANIIFINKELFEFEFLRTGKDLINYLNEKIKINKINYVFIDEIQDIEGFEKSLRDILIRKNVDIYISGSNANMLSGELASKLSGRYIEFRMNPLSYSEFLEFQGVKSDYENLNNYLKYGGMPYLKNLRLNDEIVFPYLKSIFDSIILKDVVSRYNIRNVDFLFRLTEYFAENIGNLITAKKISDYLKSQKINIPVNTVITYINFLCNTFFVNKTQRLDITGKKIFEINEKYYLEDLGLRNCIVGYNISDISKLIENAVFLHLKYLGYDVKVGTLGTKEIDFVCSKIDKRIYIQVCYLLSDENVIQREFGNLLSIPDNYDKYVISTDKFKGGNYKGIKHISLMDFLLKEEL